MNAATRALILGLAGPSIQLAGIVWGTVHVLVMHYSEPITARHLATEPALLLIIVGFLVSIVCIPAAIEVARAAPEEFALKDPGLAEEEAGRRSARGVRG